MLDELFSPKPIFVVFKRLKSDSDREPLYWYKDYDDAMEEVNNLRLLWIKNKEDIIEDFTDYDEVEEAYCSLEDDDVPYEYDFFTLYEKSHG